MNVCNRPNSEHCFELFWIVLNRLVRRRPFSLRLDGEPIWRRNATTNAIIDTRLTYEPRTSDAPLPGQSCHVQPCHGLCARRPQEGQRRHLRVSLTLPLLAVADNDCDNQLERNPKSVKSEKWSDWVFAFIYDLLVTKFKISWIPDEWAKALLMCWIHLKTKTLDFITTSKIFSEGKREI